MKTIFSEITCKNQKYGALGCLLLTSCIFTQNLSAAPSLSNTPAFNQSTVIGQVFFDSNSNGYLDKGETGIPGVLIATVTGLLIETDAYGRFHMPDSMTHSSHSGQNQLFKVVMHSLPQGSKMTSENPRLIRSTNAAMNTVNFGVVF